MNTSLEIKCINCKIQGHNDNPITGFCIDEKCNEINKFVCLDCFFDVHSTHKVIRLKELNNIIQNENKDYEQCLEEEKVLKELYNNNLLNQKEKIEQLKQNIINEIEKKVTAFLEELDKEYSRLGSPNTKDFANLNEFKKFYVDNSVPNQDRDLNKLSEICSNIYKEVEGNKNKDNKNNKKNIKNNFNLEKFNKRFDTYLDKQISYITNLLKMPKYFLISEETKFEWCNEKYYNYGFLYELSNDNKKGTKISTDGTRTILRGKEKLKQNYMYYIKLKIGLKVAGDFDVGIGKELSGNFYWLRERETLCISDKGIWNLGTNTDKSITLKNYDIVDLEICTEEGKMSFTGFINDIQVCSLTFNLNDIYIMASIQKVSNFIEVLEYYAMSI